MLILPKTIYSLIMSKLFVIVSIFFHVYHFLIIPLLILAVRATLILLLITLRLVMFLTLRSSVLG